LQTLKERLKNGESVFGGWIMTGNPAVAEIFTMVGFDWVAVDTEHASISRETLPVLLRILEKGGVTPFVRLAQNDPVLIQSALDAGAAGLIAPQINSAAEVKAFVRAAKFPPEGNRGVSFSRAAQYGVNFKDYVKNFNRNLVLVAMIENKAGVAEIDEIANSAGIDALFIGPYDFSASLGYPGEFTRPAYLDALKKVKSAARKARIPLGMHVVPPDGKSGEGQLPFPGL